MCKTEQKIAFNEEKFMESFYINNSFKHKTGYKVPVFPYAPNDSKHNKSLSDLKDFRGTVGRCFRYLDGTTLPKVELNNKSKDKSDDVYAKEKRQEAIIESAIAKIDNLSTTNLADLKDVLKKTLFDHNGNLHVFKRSIFSFQEFNYPNSALENIAIFIGNIFFEQEIGGTQLQTHLLRYNNEQSSNILFKLAETALPKLEKVNRSKNQSYKRRDAELFEVFKKDFEFISENEKRFIENIEALLKYYYFYYISHLAFNLDNIKQLYDYKPDAYKLFFSFEKESLSKQRKAYTFGWVSLEKRLKTIFSHACCLEFLSCIDTLDEYTTYDEIKSFIDALTPYEQEDFAKSVRALAECYKGLIKGVKDGGIEALNDKLKKQSRLSNSAYQAVYELWWTIDYQFNHSTRNKPYRSYSRWFITFCKKNFLLRRGRAGYSLALNQNQILFLTKLCVGNRDKIRLKTLWQELELRGISFDQKTKEAVVSLFEKINLLEKKSDSGDAQYIKSRI